MLPNFYPPLTSIISALSCYAGAVRCLPCDAVHKRGMSSSGVCQTLYHCGWLGCHVRAIVSNWVNIGLSSNFFSQSRSHTILVFPYKTAQVRVGYEKNRNFRPIYRFSSEMIQDRAIVNMERQWNSCAIYRMVPFPMILSDLRWQRNIHGFSATAELKNLLVASRCESVGLW